MSDKPKYPRAAAMAVANELRDLLAPFCSRIEIAGSLRRGKAEVGDIELVYVPKMELRANPISMFGEPIYQNIADIKISDLEFNLQIRHRLKSDGTQTWGAQNKLAVHVASGIPVDFFSTDENCWFVALVIRTGSRETNLRLTTGAQARGASLMAYGCGTREPSGQITRATSEKHVFDLCNVAYLPQEKR